MAKTTGPLLSFGASGGIGQTMVMSSWRGVPYARRYVVPANPQTSAQQTTRTTFSTLREMWKIAPVLLRAPWDAFATGRPLLGLNAFIGENLRVLRGEADMNNFIGSPGARGGLPAETVTASTGSGSGEVDVSFVTPTPPTGWTLVSAIAAAFPDQDPSVGFGGPLVAGEDDSTQSDVTLSGLGSAVNVQVAGWLEWTKPNGDTAYSVGITDQAATGA